MISERSCDTEDWSNDAENLALITRINYILKYIQIESSYFKSGVGNVDPGGPVSLQSLATTLIKHTWTS